MRLSDDDLMVRVGLTPGKSLTGLTVTNAGMYAGVLPITSADASGTSYLVDQAMDAARLGGTRSGRLEPPPSPKYCLPEIENGRSTKKKRKALAERLKSNRSRRSK